MLLSAPEVVMNVRLLTGGALLMCAALLNAQSEPKKTTEDSRQTAASEATREAQRQGRVALTPNATQSPTETVQQAIAFERYKELAAEREAQKESGATRQTATAKRKR